MQHQIQLTDRIRSAYVSMRPSERRVADYVLEHPEETAQLTIGELADRTEVSQPTVIRFVRALGFDGYRTFRYAFLRERWEGAERIPAFRHLGGALI